MRKLRDLPGAVSDAYSTHGAHVTRRFFGFTHHRAQFHQRLIEGRTIPLAGWPRAPVNFARDDHQLLGQLPELRVSRFFTRVMFDGEDARKDADYVSIQNRLGLVESDAANRASGVTADTGQCEDFRKAFWKPTGVAHRKELRGLMQI